MALVEHFANKNLVKNFLFLLIFIIYSFYEDDQLCTRIVCLNRGVCAVRNPDGPYKSVCLCPYGTSGDYCQLIGKNSLFRKIFHNKRKFKLGTLGFCSPGLCLNNAACEENVIGSTRHAYCECPPGYNGNKCENRM